MRCRSMAVLAGAVVCVSVPQFATAEDGKSAIARSLSVRLSGGLGRLAVGETNDYLESEGGFYRSSIQPVGAGLDAGLDLVWQFSNRFSLTVGTGVLRASNGGHDSYSNTYSSDTLGYQSTNERKEHIALRAIPLQLGAEAAVPLAPRLRLRLGAGAGYYFTQWSRSERFAARFTAPAPTATDVPVDFEVSSEWKASSGGLGLHGTLGLEFSLTRHFGVVFEAGGRLARFSAYDGYGSFGTALCCPGGSRGRVYIYESEIMSGTNDYMVGTGEWYRLLYMGESPLLEHPTVPGPVGESRFGLRNVHELEADFSGVSARLGVTVRF